VDGFTKEYGVHTLAYFEVHADKYEAIQREKRLKKWNRAWKIRLIEEMNPEWKTFRRTLSDFHLHAIVLPFLNGVPAFAGTTF
jgi:predicted GIY-YIG superfamily endonuclease